MISFSSDYKTGAHPKVLEKLVETNMEVLGTYGADIYSDSAKEKIKKAFNCPKGDVYFLTGGTQTNQVVISTMLENYQGVVAARTGHISLHEAGAIEYTGHKVIELEGKEGKMIPEVLKDYLETFYADENHEHMSNPGMVYISHPTEYGTLYSKKELSEIYRICKEYDMNLYIDGARLAFALASDDTDVSMEDLAKLCDVFYIGGTKCGALCGEAVVFTHDNAPKHFLTQIKQHGALVAKGRLSGVQFDALFTDELYMEIGRHAIRKAGELRGMLMDKGYRFFINSPTNQQFVILSNDVYEKMSGEVEMSFWEPFDKDSTVVRFATSWSTSEADMNTLSQILEKYKK